MKHARLQVNVLLVVMTMGAIGPPLLGPVRETLQREAGLSRGELGMWVFLVGLSGAAVGLVLGIVMRRTVRTSFFRAGALLLALACALFAAVSPAPGRALLVLAAGWFAFWVARPMVASGNGIFADLWDSSPHTGVIILHATNSVGKLAAPLVVMVLGASLARNASVYACLFAIFGIASLFWPASSVEQLSRVERGRDEARPLRLPRDPLLWMCAVQFAFITGAEAGAISILASLVEKHRAPPFWWPDAGTWPALATAVMLAGIVAGRVLFAALSAKLRERTIVALCVPCALFALPAAFCPSAWVFLPALLLTGFAFSATWPAFFGLVARAYPSERTFLSFAAAFFNSVGISGCIYLASAVGDAESRLPHAFVASAGVIGVFVVFLFATPYGRRLTGHAGDREFRG